MPSGSPSPVWPLECRPRRFSPSSALYTSGTTPFPPRSSSNSPPTQSRSPAPRQLIPSTVRGSGSDSSPDHPFSGKTQHYKSKYAISAAAMIHGGVYPDLLDDAAWWEADDLWVYSFFAFLLYVRVAAERTGRSVEEVARSIADRRSVTMRTA